VITGFNTDIEHDGVVYHVQTEDKGLDTPIILSLVYSGGAILASKRSPYKDLIAEGFSDEALAERLKRQHRLICAAIHGGRIEDLKRMSGRGTGPLVPEMVPDLTPEIVTGIMADQVTTEPVTQTYEDSSAVTQRELELRDEADETEEAPAEAIYEDEVVEEGLALALLNDQEFRSGDQPTLTVFVSDRASRGDKPLNNAAVSIKILGTTFRPLIYSLKTQKDGTATVTTQIPHFTSGRAAVLVRAVAKGKAAELRRVIHPGR
jgi:hypothetical protein